ncbi:MAG: transporter substrate-binding domain-containing protein [Treponema sp.]|nr:transporter substrate-binding domain-containing protein [Treponema sp.]
MKKNLLKIAFVATLSLALAFSMLSCKKEKNSGNVKTVIVGTGKIFAPFCYLDENGKLAGYEKDVLDAVDELLPQYKFKYETFDFANILIALQAKKVDIGAHQYGKTPQREETYLFGNQPYRAAANKIVVLKERNDISKLEDLHGKTVNTNTGNLVTEFLERYNKTLPESQKIKLIVTPSTVPVEEKISKIKNGTYDAVFTHNPADIEKWNKEYGNLLKAAGDLSKETTVYTYHVFRKGDVELRDAVDNALKKLLEDGTLSKISLKALGYDSTLNLK